MPRRNRQRTPARRRPHRNPKPLILVVCEGEVTEPGYFDGFRLACRNQLVDIEIAPGHGVPRTCVQVAKRLRNEARDAAKAAKDANLQYDFVWCVFDVDDHPDLNAALQMAVANDIRVALSNPNFELWLVLHFRDNPGLRHRVEIHAMLKSFVAGYKKHINYALYHPKYLQAAKRAKKLDELAQSCGTPGCNPTTSVYLLTELIRTGELPD